MIIKQSKKKMKKPLFKAPCNLTKNNIVELEETYLGEYPYRCIKVRFGCGKIKWKIN